MKVPSLSHDSKPSGNSYKYYAVLQFWQRLGLKARKNKNSGHLEHSLSFPNQQPIGRVFKVDSLLGIQFYGFVEDVLPGSRDLGNRLAQWLELPLENLAELETGFVIDTDQQIFYPTANLLRETANGKLIAVGDLI